MCVLIFMHLTESTFTSFNCGTSIGNPSFILKVYRNIDQKKQCDTAAEVHAMALKFERDYFAKEMRRKYAKVGDLTPFV